MAKKKDVIAAAKELNDALGLDPQIDTSASPDELRRQVALGGELLEPEDEITEKAQKVIDELREDGHQDVEPEGDEDEEEEVSEPEPEPEPKPKVKESKKEKVSAGITRTEATIKAIRSGVTRKDLPSEADRLYVESGGAENPKVSYIKTTQVYRTLVAWGAVDVDEDGNIEVLD